MDAAIIVAVRSSRAITWIIFTQNPKVEPITPQTIVSRVNRVTMRNIIPLPSPLHSSCSAVCPRATLVLTSPMSASLWRNGPLLWHICATRTGVRIGTPPSVGVGENGPYTRWGATD